MGKAWWREHTVDGDTVFEVKKQRDECRAQLLSPIPSSDLKASLNDNED